MEDIRHPVVPACTWEGRSCNGYESEGSGRGVIFYGEKGTIVYPGANSYKIFDNDKNALITEVKDDTPMDPTNKVSPFESLDTLHLKNFVESIRETEKINAPMNTASALINDFMKLGILSELTGQKRNRLFIFDQYVKLFAW